MERSQLEEGSVHSLCRSPWKMDAHAEGLAGRTQVLWMERLVDELVHLPKILQRQLLGP